ncbi:MAG TPA: WcaI family glycosyltransferase [Candidatus Acidoferrum sp.]|nr:WcaI family glycosyltransferase [Candidatus Acidoferrum sp.]
MHILVLGINYSPEKTSVAPFTTGLCEHLAGLGHRVTVVTAFPYYPEWRVWDGYRGKLYRREFIRGVEVRRVRHFVSRKPSKLLNRLAYDLSFTLAAFIAALFTSKCDLIYCSCPPPAVAFAAWLLGRSKRAPFIMKLTDLASDAALSTGIVKNSMFLRVARAFEKFTCSKALAVVCLCQGFIDRLRERSVAPEKLHLIPDWGNSALSSSGPRDASFRHAHAISPEIFLAMHTGNMGRKQDLQNLVRAAQLSRQDSGLLWLLVGEGEERVALEQEILRYELTNIRLLPLQPPEAVPQMYAAADALLLNQRSAIEDAVIPSKLLTYMSSGRAVVAAVSDRSEAARQVRRADCGVLVPAENPDALLDGVNKLRRVPALRQRLGRNGRAYAEAHFTKDRVLASYERLFAALGFPVAERVRAASNAAAD